MSKVEDYHARLESIRAILDAMFGAMEQSNANLWDRRAYLMLVGLVYDRLATSQEELPTSELTALARILAEGRRAEGRSRGAVQSDSGADARTDKDGPFPSYLGRMVRQVYGANLQDPAGEGNDPPPNRVRAPPSKHKSGLHRAHGD